MIINNTNEFTRRILNFPAIRPCESVSFSTLLASLINLGHAIRDLKSRTFYTNKKNAKNLIRLVENLVGFLEEIRDVGSKSETSMVLSLSELHFVFQKVRFLLEDCSRADARLWMLAKFEKVSTHFRILMRDVAAALDVLPVEELGLAAEAAELVDFTMKQAWRMKFDGEGDDRTVMRRVLRVLEQFEGGIAPESIDLRRVLDYLGIRSWIECNGEFMFLESEVSQENSRDLVVLSGLMAFLIYCRCTLFASIENVGKSGEKQSCEMIVGLNCDDFKCPITLDIMTDPVTISTGHTYDRSSILKWLRSGKHTCPKTGKRLTTVDLVPNHALKHIIRQHCHDIEIISGCSRVPSSGVAGTPAADQAMMLLANFLVGRLANGTDEERNKALYEIRLLTKTSIFNRPCLVGANAILVPHLLDNLCLVHPTIQENAMAALFNLISNYSRTKEVVFEDGGLSLIVDVLNSGLKVEARQHAAGALLHLAWVEEYRRAIGEFSGAIQGLVYLIMMDGPDRAKKNALAAILRLLKCPENHWRVLEAGLVPLLVNLLKSCEQEDVITHSLAVLTILAEKLEGGRAIINAGTLPTILEVLSTSDSRRVKEYCVSALLALCKNDGADVVPILAKNRYLIMALYSVLGEGTARSSKKASLLIGILHAFDEKSSLGLRASALPQEQFVHVW